MNFSSFHEINVRSRPLNATTDKSPLSSVSPSRGNLAMTRKELSCQVEIVPFQQSMNSKLPFATTIFWLSPRMILSFEWITDTAKASFVRSFFPHHRFLLPDSFHKTSIGRQSCISLGPDSRRIGLTTVHRATLLNVFTPTHREPRRSNLFIVLLVAGKLL